MKITNYIAVWILLFITFLTACGGGGGGSNGESVGRCPETLDDGFCAARVDAFAGFNGSIEPSTALFGIPGSYHFTVTPDEGYVAQVTTTCSSGRLTENVYTGILRDNCTVIAKFLPTFNVSAATGANGGINPIDGVVATKYLIRISQ